MKRCNHWFPSAESTQAWGLAACDVSRRVEYTEQHRLPAAIAATGNRIEDVRAIIIGHLHNDHAGSINSRWKIHILGGLEHFLKRDTPILVHEEELKEAFWISKSFPNSAEQLVATHNSDAGGYGKEYLNFNLNWQTIAEPFSELFAGVFLHHTPG